MTVGLNHYLLLGAVVFCIGLTGALTKKNTVTILMCIELMFNAVTLTFLSFGRFVTPGLITPHLFALFIIAVAAAEVALGLALVLAIYRNWDTVDVTTVNSMRG